MMKRILLDRSLTCGAKVTALWIIETYGSIDAPRVDIKATPAELGINDQTFRKHLRELMASGYRMAK